MLIVFRRNRDVANPGVTAKEHDKAVHTSDRIGAKGPRTEDNVEPGLFDDLAGSGLFHGFVGFDASGDDLPQSGASLPFGAAKSEDTSFAKDGDAGD